MNISVKQIIGLVAVYQIYKHRNSIAVVTDYVGSVLTEAMAGSSERIGRKVGDDLTEVLFGPRLDKRTSRQDARRKTDCADKSADIDESYEAWRSRHAANRNA